MNDRPREGTQMRLASLELLQARCFAVSQKTVSQKAVPQKAVPEKAVPQNAGPLCEDSGGPSRVGCEIRIRSKAGEVVSLSGEGSSKSDAIADAVSGVCTRRVDVHRISALPHADGRQQITVAVAQSGNDSQRAGVGRVVCADSDTGTVMATLRAVSHAGLLKAAYRANNQKNFRQWSRELMDDLGSTLDTSALDRWQRLEAESVVLEYLNRVASAAVVTAANYPKPDSVLSLFDTSAWLFDGQGARRDAYTDTDLWLAWYPGIDNGNFSVEEVIRSMPAAPETEIPWIVRLFENPSSWIRFRGAVDLEDHDVLHVLLGRGLQDQDEAFVLGFAMGTSKRVSRFQYWVFKFVLARLYPEPYRIPTFLQPAFDLGVRCGQETGQRDLYKRRLKDLRSLSLDEARHRAGIDVRVLRTYYELEQQQIPFTIASLRLP